MGLHQRHLFVTEDFAEPAVLIIPIVNSMRRVSESYHDERLLSNSSSCVSSSPHGGSMMMMMRPSRSSENLQSPPHSPKNMAIENENDAAGWDNDHDGSNTTEHQKKTGSNHHHRGMSDPFDSQRMMMDDVVVSSSTAASASAEEGTISNTNTTIGDSSNTGSSSPPVPHCLPTLPRFPVAATKNTNCWSETDISKFMVRSATYLENKRKMPSGPYLLTPRGADLLLFDQEIKKNDSTTSLSYADPTTPLPVEKFLNGQLLKQPTIAIIFRFPWGCMNQYFALPDLYRPFLQQQQQQQQDSRPPSSLLPSMVDFSPAQKCLAEWLCASDDEKNARLKLIALVDEGPFLVRQLVTGRPVLIGTKLALTYRHIPDHDVLLCELNIGSGSMTAKRIVSVCRRYMNALTVDLGWLIQAEKVDHLPETMMGAVRLHHPDALQAPKLI
jgi:hypothetical protein